MTDDERLAQVIVDSIKEVERYFETEEAEAEGAFRAVARAELAMEKLSERLWSLRGRLDAIVAPLWPEISRQDDL